MTLTWTLSVSPGRKSGMSVRCEAASRASSVCIGISSLAVPQVIHGGWGASCGGAPSWRSALPVAGALAAADRRAQSATGPSAPGQSSVRPGLPSRARPAARGRALSSAAGSSAASRSGRRFAPYAAAPRRAASGRSGRGRRRAAPRAPRAAPGGRLGVDGRLEQARRRADSSTQRVGVAEHAGQQPGDGLDDHQHRDLAAGEHVVAEGDLGHPARRRGLVEHPLVDALVAAAGEDQPRLGGQLVRERLGERRAARRRDDERGTPARRSSTASRASPHGSGRMTMPGPPPYGVSSTVRCRSWVQSRRSCTRRSSGRARAPADQRERSGARYSGRS